MQLPETLSMNLIFWVSAGFVVLLLVLACIVLKDTMNLLKIRKDCICEADATLVSFKKTGKKIKGVYEVILNGTSRRYESAVYGNFEGNSPKEGSRVKIMIDPTSPKAVYDPFVSGLLRRNLINASESVVFAGLFSTLLVFCLTGIIPL